MIGYLFVALAALALEGCNTEDKKKVNELCAWLNKNVLLSVSEDIIKVNVTVANTRSTVPCGLNDCCVCFKSDKGFLLKIKKDRTRLVQNVTDGFHFGVFANHTRDISDKCGNAKCEHVTDMRFVNTADCQLNDLANVEGLLRNATNGTTLQCSDTVKLTADLRVISAEKEHAFKATIFSKPATAASSSKEPVTAPGSAPSNAAATAAGTTAAGTTPAKMLKLTVGDKSYKVLPSNCELWNLDA